MFRSRRTPTTDARRGIILLVVLALLTLFAIVGISFVLYANAEADSSRIYREAQGFIDLRPDIPTDQLLNWALGQAIYDVDDRPPPNDANDHLYSAMRGHSLARDMYGWNSDNPDSNIFPFNGTGRFYNTYPAGSPAALAGQEDHNLINYTYFASSGDGFIRDPERYPYRSPASPGAKPENSPLQPYTGGWNAPYTFPDLNHSYLAAVDSKGNILTPSFYRNWNGFGNIMDPPTVNANWINPAGKYLLLRPRPADMATGFPYPASANGDVQNAVGITNGPDSFWMDLDFPEQPAPDGTKFKPLFAFLIMDLDNRINLNVAGNIRGSGNAHVSNRGYGPWEVNPRLLYQSTSTDWPQLYTGNPTAKPPATGRYGSDQQPGVAGSSAPGDGHRPHVYAQTDFDALDPTTGGATGAYNLPMGANCFPTFPNPGYGNGNSGSAPDELVNHPSQYSFFNPTGGDRRFPLSDMQLLLNNGTSGTLWQSSSFGQLCPKLFAPPAAPAPWTLRNLVTTDSYDVNRPGVLPWLFDRTAANNNYTAPMATNPYGPPFGGQVPMPALAQRAGAVPGNSEFRIPGQSGNTGANAVDWRWYAVDSLGNALTKIDLNRFLPPYPHMGKWMGFSQTPPIPPDPSKSSGWVFYNGNANSAELAFGAPYSSDPNAVIQYQVAEKARQNLAGDIYRCFLAVTGVPPLANPAAPTSASDIALLQARRWLAQLAVNIVDYIDEDDISTPFNFGQQENPPIPEPATATTINGDWVPLTWVFGTELPRVVLNEVYAEYQQPTSGAPAYTGMSGPFNVRFWAELYNPLPNAATPTGAQPQDANAVPLYIGSPASGGYQPYQVVIAKTNPGGTARGLWQPPGTMAQQNVLGTPGVTGAAGEIRAQTATPATGGGTDFTQTWTLTAAKPTINTTPAATPPSLSPQGALLLGPSTGPDQADMTNNPNGPDVEGTINVGTAPGGTAPRGQLPANTNAVLTGNMQYSVTATYAGGTYTWPNSDNVYPNSLTVLLRRLANPYMVWQNDPTKPNYNPYITIDYIDTVRLQDSTVPHGDYTPRSAAPHFPAPGTTSWPPTTPNNYQARGKSQPFAADLSQINDEAYPSTPPAGAPASQTTPTPHTLGLVPNTPTAANYDWLVHLDRPLISPGELLHVSAYAPFLLTHQFITGSGKFMHRAPWFDEPSLGVTPTGGTPNSARIYRALEFLDVHNRAAGVGFSGRVPGRVNINTIWDQETFSALCDEQPGNAFTGSAAGVWTNVQASRGNPGSTANPFLGMAVGNSPGGDPWFQGPAFASGSGINNTLLRNAPAGGTPTAPGLFQVSSLSHPYQYDELLTKILNNITTRSNVFAVWITVGFFPVVQDTDAAGNPVRPIKLGAEIGLSTNTNIRHRLFAIVDRSSLAIDQQVTTLSAAVNASPDPQNLPVAATSGTTSNTKINWSIGAGTVLLVGSGSSKEGVLVTNNGGTLQAIFQLPHKSGDPVTIPGNPGPQTGFNVHDPTYKDVVPYFAIMQ